MSKEIITLKNVSKVYKNDVVALKDVNVKINKGEFIYVIGASGSGKSTFAKLLYREEKPTSGEVIINGFNISELEDQDTYKLRRTLGVVFQDYKLLKNKTVFENVAYAMESIGLYDEEIKDRVNEVLDAVGLSNKSNIYPNKLSGGEQQRVAIARAIVNHPDILIADEPTGNLDPDTTWSIMHILERINLMGITVVMVTHDSNVVNKLRHRIIKINDSQLVADIPDGESIQ